jgi:uncharacterized membrane protein
MHVSIRDGKGHIMGAYSVDILAVGFFVIEWTVYAVTLEHTAYGRDSLSARMNVYREVWIRRLLDREARMVDMQIMASLQNGTAFFASTSLLAIGGGLALLRATNEALTVLGALPVNLSPSPALWEIKCVGLILIFVYAFFKFAWSYRLFNYVAILLGAMPPAEQRDTSEAEAHVIRTSRLFEAAGRHFNRGQRAFFFALGYLGWFVSPWVLFVTTALVVIVTWRRQFRLQCLARDGHLARQKKAERAGIVRIGSFGPGCIGLCERNIISRLRNPAA